MTLSLLNMTTEQIQSLVPEEGEIVVAFLKDGSLYTHKAPISEEISDLFEVMHTAFRTLQYIKDPEAYKKKYNIV